MGITLYMNQKVIKNPNAKNNCENAEHELKVTLSQQMMSIGDSLCLSMKISSSTTQIPLQNRQLPHLRPAILST